MQERVLPVFRALLILSILCCRPVAAATVDAVQRAEREAAEADREALASVIRLADADVSCNECAEVVEGRIAVVVETRIAFRNHAYGTPIEPGREYDKAIAARHESALRTRDVLKALAAECEALRRAKSYCGKCAADGTDRRLEKLAKSFGNRDRAKAVLGAQREAVALLQKSSHALLRRLYEPHSARRFDPVFERWIGTPTLKNLSRIGDRLDVMMGDMLLKMTAPEQFIVFAPNYPDKAVKELDLTVTYAFVVLDDAKYRNLVFIAPAFFSQDSEMPLTLIHEESHLIDDTRDHGWRQQTPAKMRRKKRRLGTGTALNDSYSFENLVAGLAKL